MIYRDNDRQALCISGKVAIGSCQTEPLGFSALLDVKIAALFIYPWKLLLIAFIAALSKSVTQSVGIELDCNRFTTFSMVL